MQILGSTITANSQHRYVREETVTQLQWQRETSTTAPPATEAETQDTAPRILSVPQPTGDIVPAAAETSDPQSQLDAKLVILKAMVEALTGQSIRTYSAPADTSVSSDATHPAPNPGPASSADSSTNPPPNNLETVTLTEWSLYESESSDVSISATVLIDSGDGAGQFLDINLSLGLYREFSASATELSVRRGPLTDPLVINFDRPSASLSGPSSRFDLNGDGQLQAIPTLDPGSGYLALDKNANGTIDSGLELFGPASGNGFNELAVFDEDGNGFIDAKDTVFSQLRVFRPASGNVQTLADLQLSAIYTGSVASPFQLTDNNNQLLGQIRSTGFYLDNDGNAGAVQQIDLNA